MTPHQFTLDLLALPTPTLDNFVAGANGAALAALRDVLAGRGPAFVHLWGPAGCGRSHLIAAVRNAAAAGGALRRTASAPVVGTTAEAAPDAAAEAGADAAPDAAAQTIVHADGDAHAATHTGAAPVAAPAVPEFIPGRHIYTADDVHLLDADGQARLFGLQNAVRQHPGCFLLTSANQPPAHLELREDVRSRLAWGLVFALHPIAEPDQAAALAVYAQSRGARVDAELVPYMLTRLPRDMRTLVSVLDALDAFALSRQRALTVPLLREWLQGAGAGALAAPARPAPEAPRAPSPEGSPGPAAPGQ